MCAICLCCRMVDKVDLAFKHDSKWVLNPQVVYIRKYNHVWEGYDPNLLSYIDICKEYTEKLGFRVVKQLLVTGPSGRYYFVEIDARIRTLQSSLSSQFSVLKFFAIDEGEDSVSAPNVIQHKEPCFVSVYVGSDCESGEEEEDDNEPVSSDCDSKELKLFRK
ncbi:hypothetical protein RND71_020965 [Anisodus tanguticus]|uniref:Uncharacterized protein n=1 Tax=Anisodus tanguticus TaxID=243964 RepID=A0AAE1VCE1_9SOLA|nr:hypothetical protein RND71_020965 [Anisodus tanguticus]